jgi:hypothetical protein
MTALAHTARSLSNPLDRVERLAQSHEWSVDRPNDHEVVMQVAGGWADMNLSLTWRDDLESLLVACLLDLKVPEKRREEVQKLLDIINSRLIHGHFDLWPGDGTIVFRNSLLLAGAAEVTDEQCEAMLGIGIETCQRYYPAIQFVIWAGHTAVDALDSALIETMGEA